MTQQQLAAQVGVTRRDGQCHRSRQCYSPSLEVAFRIARVFDKPLEEVFQFPRRVERRRGTRLIAIVDPAKPVRIEGEEDGMARFSCWKTCRWTASCRRRAGQTRMRAAGSLTAAGPRPTTIP